VLALVLHTARDSRDSLAGTAVVAVVSLGLLGWTVHHAAGRRRRTSVVR
jgi:hypothetical protein